MGPCLSTPGSKEDRQDEASIRPQVNVSTSESRHPSQDKWSPRGAEALAETSAGHVASHRPELSPRKLQSIESGKQLADPGQEREATSPAAEEVNPVPEREGPRKTSSREATSVFSAETVSKLEQQTSTIADSASTSSSRRDSLDTVSSSNSSRSQRSAKHTASVTTSSVSHDGA